MGMLASFWKIHSLITFILQSPVANHLYNRFFLLSISYHLLIFSFSLALPNFCLAQQMSSSENLTGQLARLDSAFLVGDVQRFNQIVELGSMRELFAAVVKEEIKREPGKFKIIAVQGNTAYVLISGIFRYGNSGDETNLSTKYTGIYRFALTGGSWRLMERIEIDRSNRINKQRLYLAVNPGTGVKIIDTLTIDVNDQLGFAAKLNHKAALQKVLLNNSSVDYLFSGGMLWLGSPPQKDQQLIIEYSLAVERDDNNTNSSYFGPFYGHLRNQYFWHPFFSFSSANDRADFEIRCQVPKSFQLATSLPQKDLLSGDDRIITGKSEIPTFGLSIYYDRDWRLRTFKKDQIDMVVYATPDFAPGDQLLYDQFSKSYDILHKTFGKPVSNYLGIVQDRTGGNGWKNRANSVVVAGQSGSYLITNKPNPRAIFGHEVAHGWTSPTGPATNFLMEGWATYAESVLLKNVYGDSIVAPFFQSQKQNYLNGNFEGEKSLWEDYSNSGISYSKGAWLFYMLETQLGKEKFSEGMRGFVGSKQHTIHAFMREMSRAANKDMEPFISSWLKSKHIPHLKIQKIKSGIEIVQEGEPLWFQLEVQILLKSGVRLSRTLDFRSGKRSLKVAEREMESWVIDPNQKLLHQITLAEPTGGRKN